MWSSTDAIMPVIISKLYCSSSPVVLLIRKRPVVVNGGGFVVTDSSSNRLLFVVDGCGKLGAKGVLKIKDGDGESILYILKKGGIVQALSTQNKWNGYSTDYQGQNKLIFSLTDPKSCFALKGAIRISVEPKRNSGSWDFEVNGSFVDKAFSLVDRNRRIVAQVEVGELTGSKDLYQVWIQSGYDQAFVIGVIAVLDNIFGESTSCN